MCLVPDEDTIAALARFVRDLSAAHARLLPRRLKVDSIRGEIDRIDRTVQEKTDLEPTRIHGLLKRRQELEGELLPAQLELLKACQAAVRRLNLTLVPVVQSVRRELDIPLDEQVLLGVIQEDARSQTELVDDLLREAAAAREPTQQDN